MPADPMKKIVTFLFSVVGGLMLFTSLGWFINNRQWVKGASRAPGRVVALNHGGSHPQIEFKAADGKVTSYSQDGLIFGYKVGDEVTVLYDPAKPHEANLESFGSIYGFNLMIAIMGLAFLIAPRLNFPIPEKWRRR